MSLERSLKAQAAALFHKNNKHMHSGIHVIVQDLVIDEAIFFDKIALPPASDCMRNAEKILKAKEILKGSVSPEELRDMQLYGVAYVKEKNAEWLCSVGGLSPTENYKVAFEVLETISCFDKSKIIKKIPEKIRNIFIPR